MSKNTDIARKTVKNFGDEAITGVKTFSDNTIHNGSVLVKAPASLGYGTGAGGTVTQLTSKSTTVTLNKPSGKIIMNNAALTGGAPVAFQINNSIVTANDTIVATIDSAAANFDYIIQAYAGSGYIEIRLLNNSGTTLSQPIGINFTVIKGAIA